MAKKKKAGAKKSPETRSAGKSTDGEAGAEKGAAGKTEKSGADKRQHPRVPLEMLVQIRSDSIDEFRSVHAKNISIGGMFIETNAPRPKDTQVYFQFTVKDGGTLIEGLGRVVHASDKGMGVEFVSVLEPSASIIRVLVEERLKASA